MANRPVIDVLLPSRGRPELLASSIRSLRLTAACPRSVQIHVGADSDDPLTDWVAAGLHARCYLFDPQGYDRLHVYYQHMAQASSGQWLLVWNDDAVMLTQGWDEVLWGLPPSVLVADLQSHHSPMCCFPAVRREAVVAAGKFSSDNPHVDSFWEVVGNLSGTLATVPVQVRHEQQGGHAGNEHGFHDPAHLAELAACAQRCRDAVLADGRIT
jgi:hypothetical protein